MPIHDWTRVHSGTYHSFHISWCTQIRDALNIHLLNDCYAQIEPSIQTAEPFYVDVENVAVSAPRVKLVDEAEMDDYVLKRRTIVIRHNTGDRIIALLEIVSPGNKSSKHAFESFVEKAVEALYRGYHLMIIDLFPPTVRDPEGIHSAIWHEFNDSAFALPKELPLTLAAYSAGQRKKAYVEPTAVGRELIEMPLFLTEDRYINVPLEETYQLAFHGVARKFQALLNATIS